MIDTDRPSTFTTTSAEATSTGTPAGSTPAATAPAGTGATAPAGDDRPQPPTWFDTHDIGPNLRQWLVLRRNAGATPADIAAELVAGGWDADSAARVSMRSLRSSDRQTLMYATSTFSAGIAALTAASAAHLIIDQNPRPMDLTVMLTVCLVAAPIAVLTTLAARRAEGRSTYVMWSPTRRGWFGALALCTATVGVLRLLAYLYLAIATITGASEQSFSLAAAAQVLVTLLIAVPLFGWSFREWRRSNLVISALTRDDGTDGTDGDTANTAATSERG